MTTGSSCGSPGAINLYLAKKYKSPLWPDTPQGEGNMLQWAFDVADASSRR